MADELNKNAEFAGKHQDEEDPILTAQRYLNIYRQIHIFNKKRQDEFDDSLLTISPDLRILLGTLPGGSLLVEHITELETQRGIINLEHIDDVQPTHETSKNISPLRATSKQNDNVAINNNILKIIQQNEEKHTKELQALTNAFIQSQENMAHILQQVLEKQASSHSEETKHETDKAETSLKPETPKSESKQKSESKHKSESKQKSKSEQKQESKPQKQEKTADEEKVEDNQPTETTSKLLKFTKNLFHKNDEETETTSARQNAEEIAIETQNPSILIDNTPVSLDDIGDAPVALDVQDADTTASHADSEQTPTSEASSEASSDDDWDWQYVDEEGDDLDDTEWEYIEEDMDGSEHHEDLNIPDASDISDTHLDNLPEEIVNVPETDNTESELAPTSAVLPENPDEDYTYEEIPENTEGNYTYEETPENTDGNYTYEETSENTDGNYIYEETPESTEGGYMYEETPENTDSEYTYETGSDDGNYMYGEVSGDTDGGYVYDASTDVPTEDFNDLIYDDTAENLDDYINDDTEQDKNQN